MSWDLGLVEPTVTTGGGYKTITWEPAGVFLILDGVRYDFDDFSNYEVVDGVYNGGDHDGERVYATNDDGLIDLYHCVEARYGGFVVGDVPGNDYTVDATLAERISFTFRTTEADTGVSCETYGTLDGVYPLPTDGNGSCDDTDLVDSDSDGVVDDCDAFPDDPAESADSDGDGVGDNADECPEDPGGSVTASWYADLDGDGFGDPADGLSDCGQPDSYVSDATDCDDDDPGVHPGASETCDGLDNDCDEVVPDAELDVDGDGLPTCAGDCDDLDETLGDTPTWYEDADVDGLGDAYSPVSGGCEAPDGTVADSSDLCPVDPENDADLDGICEVDDNCDSVANSDQSDVDGDGEGDQCDVDIDGDGVANGSDNCAFDANADQADLDGDGEGDLCDDDLDGDGVLDAVDSCLDDAAGEAVDATGCSITQLCPCDNDWKNHGAYVSCVAHASADFVDAGLIAEGEQGSIQSEAGGSECGHKNR